jgi:choline-glycine betaine transporter
MTRDILAIASGLGAFLILHIGYIYLEAWITNAFWVMACLFFATPVLSGGVTGYLARRQPFLCLVVLGVAVAVCIGVLRPLSSWLGIRMGVGGLSSSVTLGVFSLIFVLPMVVIGGAIGAFISRARA